MMDKPWSQGQLTQQGSGHGIKVLFINPPSLPYNMVRRALANRSIAFNQVVAMPMGILYLAATLEQSLPGIQIRIVDLARAAREFSQRPDRPETTIEGLTETILDRELDDGFVPDYVGISILFSTAHRSTGEIAAALKRRFPHAPIVTGGMHATNAVDKLLSMEQIDYVCRGEAESIIVPLTLALNRRQPVDDLPGVYGRSKLAAQGGQAAELSPWIEDLDQIPFPAWHLIPMADYIQPSGRARRLDTICQDGEATILTTRGCPFSCTFCASWTVHGRKVRYRSQDNVLAEMDILYHDHGVRIMVPEDDLFTVKKSRIIGLCDAVAQRYSGTVHFQFPNGLSVATLDDDVIAALMRMGMSVATIAIESGSPHVQRHIIKKNASLERARAVVQSSRDQGAIVRCYYVIGFPGETREMIQETIDFSASIAADWSVYNVAAPLIGSEMYEQLLDQGHIDQNFNWDESFFHERSFDTPEINAADLKRMAYSANIRNNFFGNHNLRIGAWQRAETLFNDILLAYPDHIAAQYCIGLAQLGMGNADAHAKALDACRVMLANAGPDSMSLRIFQEFQDLFPDLTPPPTTQTSTWERPMAQPRGTRPL